MALSYAHTFSDIGSLIKALNQFRQTALGGGSSQPDIPALLANVNSVFTGNGDTDQLNGMGNVFDGYKDSMVSLARGVGGLVQARLMDRNLMLTQLNGLSPNPSIQDVLRELYRQMGIDSESVQKNTVTIGATTAASGNTGNGTIVTTKVLDGKSIPIRGGAANLKWLGANSELSVSETLTFTCVQDEDSDGWPSGEELFLVEGTPDYGVYNWRGEGSGERLFANTASQQKIIANQDFEVWGTGLTANIPANWDKDAGTAGTNIIQETTAASVHRGSFGLKLVGDGATASIQLSQTMRLGAFTPGKAYVVGFYVQGTAGMSAGSLTVEFESASGGYTAASSEKVTLTNTQLAALTTYTLKYFFINIPAQVPDDFELVIKLTGTPSAHAVRIDSMAVSEVKWANGIGFAIFPGSTPFVRNDRFTIAVTNDKAGVFQEFFRRYFKFQLPSSATPSRSDSLAT